MPITLPPKQITVTPDYQICETCLNAPFSGDRKCIITVDPIETREDGDIQGEQFQKDFPMSYLLPNGGDAQLDWLSGVLQSNLPEGATLHHVSFHTPRSGLGNCNMVYEINGKSSECNIPITKLLAVEGAQDFYDWLKASLYDKLLELCEP